ncbi:MAG: ferrous iron transport protein B [Clostridia bacterium]
MQIENKIVALAGNPNVGKSTVFNALTGLNQHTGNWTGKTVELAYGKSRNKEKNITFVDLPGTYSLSASSKEEEVARDFIAFDKPFLTVIVCDACCLERNLNLVMQILAITSKVIVCVNLISEAKKRGITIDLIKLEKLLKVPVIGICAKKKKTLEKLLNKIDEMLKTPKSDTPYILEYQKEISEVTDEISKNIKTNFYNKHLLAEKLLIGDMAFVKMADSKILTDEKLLNLVLEKQKSLESIGILKQQLEDNIISSPIKKAEEIADVCVKIEDKKETFALKVDKIVTSKKFGIPIMVLLISLIFWLTIVGSNYPSSLLATGFANIKPLVCEMFLKLQIPPFIIGVLVDGVYTVLTWVIAVMLPPMAIFFPLFTFLEDLGYLPRIAFNLDKGFNKCSACGKQGLTMAMGFGCNAVGVVGARIIDSPRERLIAIITNNIVPCNGRFPSIIAIISIFLVANTSLVKGLWSAFFLTLVILFSICMTFVCSYILSKTLLKGERSSFTLELPPYRTPKISDILVRSFLDRTLYVLMRAIIVAAPAGLIIYLLSNFIIGDTSILHHINQFLDPFGRIIGLDGVIITAFILGFPANEIVIPIILMSYMSNGTLVEMASLSSLQTILMQNGWTVLTGICFIVFSLIHFPCSTTLLTIKKETKSLKWTFVSFIYPTLVGILLCFLINIVGKTLLLI